MRKRAILLSVLLMLFVSPAAVKAEQALKLQLAYISVWPEYEYSADKPGQLNVLVINRFVLDGQNIQSPLKVKIQIPATAVKPHVVAVGETPETVSDQNVEFTTSSPSGDWIDVFVTTNVRAIQLEYYDYNVTKTGLSREYIYRWPGTYKVNTFHFEVRVPLQATNMRSDPDATTMGTDTEGFRFGEMTVPGIPAGKIFTVKINYDRDTDAPSSTFLDVQPSAPLDQPVAGQFSLGTYMPWILGGLTLLVVGVAAGWFWLSGRSATGSSKLRKRRLPGKQKKSESDGQIYCHECGKRAQPGDLFCRTCGARLRRAED
jgi:hypothetical protein